MPAPVVAAPRTLPVIIHSRYAIAKSVRPKARNQPARAVPIQQNAPEITLQDIFGPRVPAAATNPIKPGPAQIVLASTPGVTRSLRPQQRPGTLTTQPSKPRVTLFSSNGSVCGDRSIRGQNLSRIPAKLPGCGLSDPVRVTEVDGIRLSIASTMDCTTAKAMKTWINKGVRPAVGRTGGGVASLRVVAHYSCRTRNNLPGAKISEHGRGRAIDIAGIGLADGSELTILTDWKNTRRGRILKQVHRAACGPFGTVLGPDANRFHKDHFHFDTARYRSGSYCR